MAAPDKSGPQTQNSEQVVLNDSRDDRYGVLAVELLAENEAGTNVGRLLRDTDGNLKVSLGTTEVTLDASDIQIGAVELKNATTDDRATVSAAGALKVDGSAVTQPVSGTVAVTSSDLTSLLLEIRLLNNAMAQLVDDTTGTIYRGWAEPGTATSSASWRITRIVSSGTPEDTAITFADGNRNFDNIWDNRASLSYS